MSKLLKMAIQGVRAFDPEESSSIEFGTPLTMIVGTNGCGKTTIIECLKFALSGSYPPGGTEKGKNFVHDPRICGLSEVKANVRVRFLSYDQKRYVVFRYMQVKQQKTRQTFSQLDGVLSKLNEDETRTKLSHKCGELDKSIPILLGVTNAVLESVIFCHQEESNWPIDGPKELKARFDDIFASSRYTTALGVLKKKKNELHKQEVECNGDLKGLASRKKHADSIRKMLQEADDQVKKLDGVLETYNDTKAALSLLVQRIHSSRSGIVDKERDIENTSRTSSELARNMEHIKATAGTDGIFDTHEIDDQELKATKQELDKKDEETGQELFVLEEEKAQIQTKIIAKRQQISDLDLDLGSLRGKLDERTKVTEAFQLHVKELNDVRTTQTISIASTSAEDYEAEDIVSELQLLASKAQKALKRTQEERDLKANEAAATVAKCNAELEAHRDSVQKAQVDRRKLQTDIESLSAQITKACGTYVDIDALEAQVHKLDERLKDTQREAKQLIETCEARCTQIDTELHDLQVAEPELKRKLVHAEQIHQKLEVERGRNEERTTTINIFRKARTEFRRLYLESVGECTQKLLDDDDAFKKKELLTASDEAIIKQAPVVEMDNEHQSLADLFTYAENLDRIVSSKLDKVLDRNENEHFQKEAQAIAEYHTSVQAQKNGVDTVKKAKDAADFKNKDHPIETLAQVRIACKSLERKVKNMFIDNFKGSNTDTEKEPDTKYKEYFSKSIALIESTECFKNLTADDDCSEYTHPSLEPLSQTLGFMRQFLLEANACQAQILAESQLLTSYEKSRDEKHRCHLCRRKFADDLEDAQHLNKHIKNMKTAANIQLVPYIQQAENIIETLSTLEANDWREWLEAIRTIQKAEHELIALNANITAAEQKKEKASSELDEMRALRKKLKQIQSNTKVLASVASDTFKKQKAMDDLVTPANTFEKNSTEAQTVQEAIENINKIRQNQTANAEKKANLHADRAKLEREIAQSKSKISNESEEYTRVRTNLDKATELSERRTQLRKEYQEISNQEDGAKARERDLKNALDDAETLRDTIYKDHGVKCNQAQSALNKAQNDLQQFTKLKEESDAAVTQAGDLSKKIEQLQSNRISIVEDEEKLIQKSHAIDESIQIAGDSDDGRTRLRARINTTLQYRKVSNDLTQSEQDVDELRRELDVLCQAAQKEMKEYLQKADSYEFGKRATSPVEDIDTLDPSQTKEKLSEIIRKMNAQLQSIDALTNRSLGAKEQHVVIKRQKKKELNQDEFKNVDDDYLSKKQEHAALRHMCADLDIFWESVDKALQEYHSAKIKKINDHIRELWQHTYRGEDIDYIEIVSGEEAASSRANRSYNYQVLMSKSGAMVDMRYRCSAGQRVLASIVIRLALAQEFGLNCGVLCLDEPTCNLDEANRRSLAHGLVRLIAHRSSQANFQLIVITHDEAFITLMRNELQTTAQTALPEFFWKLSREKKASNDKFYSKITKVSLDAIDNV